MRDYCSQYASKEKVNILIPQNCLFVPILVFFQELEPVTDDQFQTIVLESLGHRRQIRLASLHHFLLIRNIRSLQV